MEDELTVHKCFLFARLIIICAVQCIQVVDGWMNTAKLLYKILNY